MNPRREDKGAVLVMALITVMIVGTLAYALLSALTQGAKNVGAASVRDELLNAAESGIELALWRLARDPDWRGGQDIEVPGGDCSVSVKRAAGGDPGTGLVLSIKSRAVQAGRECVVAVKARAADGGRFLVTGWSVRCGRQPERAGNR